MWRQREFFQLTSKAKTKEMDRLPTPDCCACGAALVDFWLDGLPDEQVALKACPRERCFRCGAPAIVRVFHLGRWLVACHAHRRSHQSLPGVRGGGGDHVLWCTPAEVRATLEQEIRSDRHPLTVRAVTAQLAALPTDQWEIGCGSSEGLEGAKPDSPDPGVRVGPRSRIRPRRGYRPFP